MGRGLSQLSLLSSFGISGLGSHFGLALGTWVFRWAGLFLGPGEWAWRVGTKILEFRQTPQGKEFSYFDYFYPKSHLMV